MPINGFLYPGASGPPAAYEVDNSLRFDDGSSNQLYRVTSAGSDYKATFSAWVKRTTPGVENFLLYAYYNSNNKHVLNFYQDQIYINLIVDASTAATVVTNRVFRDISAWMHVVVAWDTTQSTASDRIKVYVNGVQETSFGTANYPNQNTNIQFNRNTNGTYVGGQAGSNNFDGYMSEVVYIDGSALDPTSFGEFDSDTPNVWKPIDVSGLTFGTNGFYLEFKQSGTSQNSSGLGADTSGNDNHLAAQNLTSVAQSTDTCTNNFAILNSLYKQDHAFSDGNLTHTSSASDWDSGVSTIAASSGKYYFEAKVTAIEPPTRTMLGVGDVRDANEIAEDQFGLTNYDNGDTVAYYGSDGSVYKNGSQQSGSWSSFTTNDIVGMYVDLDNGKVYFHKNGTMQNSGDPTSGSTGTGAISITTGQTYVFGVTHYGGGAGQINFGSPPFSISSGNSDPNGYGNFEYSTQNYYALNTKNLAEFG